MHLNHVKRKVNFSIVLLIRSLACRHLQLSQFTVWALDWLLICFKSFLVHDCTIFGSYIWPSNFSLIFLLPDDAQLYRCLGHLLRDWRIFTTENSLHLLRPSKHNYITLKPNIAMRKWEGCSLYRFFWTL
jgi:hypothetical protein